MGEVIHIPPKKHEGVRGNAAYFIQFDRITKTWKWRVEVQVDPTVFSGNCNSETEAKAKVNEYVRNANGRHRTGTTVV
jgi:hypothetical protein